MTYSYTYLDLHCNPDWNIKLGQSQKYNIDTKNLAIFLAGITPLPRPIIWGAPPPGVSELVLVFWFFLP